MTHRVAGVILAAGSSARMGRPKALLEIGGSTFIGSIIRSCMDASVSEIVIVLGADSERIRTSISESIIDCGSAIISSVGPDAASVRAESGARVIVNEAWESGRLSSIVTGIDAVEQSDCDGALIWPVDHPLVSPACIRSMISAFEQSPEKIVIPVFEKRRGHPIVLPRRFFDDVRQAPADPGLRAVIRAHGADICETATDVEGILVNIDTPEDFKKYINVETDHGT
ncbi:MAG TPA: nucleotidyltransferase family protein [Bacteroidota bacterium]|nr:nucleotidyltransferase family protein [Bacteroidota bacterium]